MPDVQHETWRSAIRGQVVIKKYDRRGNLVDEIITGGSRFQITEEERAANSSLAATSELDVFKNGMLVPVKLLDGTEDKAEIASNPNLMTEADLQGMFKMHWKTFEAKLQTMTNALTLQRLLELAGTEEIDATMRQVNSIKARLGEVGSKVVERQTFLPGGQQVQRTSQINPVTT